jgi:deoxyribodipyrimidine photo-lyase
MSEKFENGLFIFRRDFRIVDNNGLNLINQHCKNIYTIFIFTPEQVTNTNQFKSDNAVQFMIESLEDLESQISNKGGKLYSFYGHNEKIVSQCIKEFNIDVICFNLDYTPYAIKRDNEIIALCEKMKTYVMYDYDYYLHEPGSILTGSKTPYQKFTPYYQAAMKKKIQAPQHENTKKLHLTYTKKTIPNRISLNDAMHKFTKENSDILVHGGRENALRQLSRANKTQGHYSSTHNELSKSTSELSAYIKFGCVSIREVYHVLKTKHELIRQLVWRDFYANILYSFPHVLGNAMKKNYNKINWHHNSNHFEAWREGMTGFPIVDAGMRQLNQTGYMHNRARLITASFLVKTLLISWEHGEKYFAKKLTDYDPASNNGNWQWIASTGADSQPFFRIFNPWEQAKNFDPNAEYIKKWVPELRDVPVKDIMNWGDESLSRTPSTSAEKIKYPKPIVDYSKQKKLALKMYNSVFH